MLPKVSRLEGYGLFLVQFQDVDRTVFSQRNNLHTREVLVVYRYGGLTDFDVASDVLREQFNVKLRIHEQGLVDVEGIAWGDDRKDWITVCLGDPINPGFQVDVFARE